MKEASIKPLALIVGVGDATGRAVCTALTSDYRLAMVARSTKVIDSLSTNLEDAIAYPCDVTDREAWISVLNKITVEMGLPEYILINTEGGGWGNYSEIAISDFSNSFEVNVVSLLILIQTLFPVDSHQAQSEHKCRIIISSSPAAYLSAPMFLGIAPSRAGQRVLAETLDTTMDHVDFSILSIEGAIDESNMRKVYAQKGDEFFIRPAAIAAHVQTLFKGDVLKRATSITAVDS